MDGGRSRFNAFLQIIQNGCVGFFRQTGQILEITQGCFKRRELGDIVFQAGLFFQDFLRFLRGVPEVGDGGLRFEFF